MNEKIIKTPNSEKTQNLTNDQYINTKPSLDIFTKEKIGVIGSPSSTSMVTVDILEHCFYKKLLGQLVFYLQTEGETHTYVIGQLTSMVTLNRWHEDMNFRPLIKRKGVLNHLSVESDVKTALLTIQSSFTEDRSIISGNNVHLSLLGTSPTTSTPVYIVSNDLLDYLLSNYRELLTYIGYIFETKVAMPTWFKHFGNDLTDPRAAGEAYHIGIFGKTGSGKSVLSAYVILSYALNENMAILLIDPQGQFSKNRDFRFDWHGTLDSIGREPIVIDAATDLYLIKKDLFPLLLEKRGFFKQLGIKHPTNQENAIEELRKYIRVNNIKLSDNAPELLRSFLEELQDQNTISKIYSTKDGQNRVLSVVEEYLQDQAQFDDLEQNYWLPVLTLFASRKKDGNPKYSVRDIAVEIVEKRMKGERAPFFILDISKAVKGFISDDDIKTLYIGRIIRWIDTIAQENYEKDERANALIVMDEAQKFLTSYKEDEEIRTLRGYIVNGVKTHRKYGVGYMLITQNISSLDNDIISQLRIFFVGFGLVGSDLARLSDILPDPKALEFYKGSFIDPKNTGNKKFPFMFFGPVSPLSFSGSPLFMHVFTDINDFKRFNYHHFTSEDEEYL